MKTLKEWTVTYRFNGKVHEEKHYSYDKAIEHYNKLTDKELNPSLHFKAATDWRIDRFRMN